LNLLPRTTNFHSCENTVSNFRNLQYTHIEDLLNNCLDYISRFGFDRSDIGYELSEFNKYKSPYYFAIKNIKLYFKSEPKKYLLNIDIPKLIENTFFKLRGVYYVPILYIVDEPIVLKKNSLKLSSMFKSITIYFNDSRAIFNGMNIPLSRFFRLFIDNENIVQNICSIYNSNYFKEPRERSIKLVSEELLGFPYEDDFVKYIEALFFDNWTTELYSKYYNLETPTLEQLLTIATVRKRDDVKPLFNDLNYKRLVFIELLLDPIIKSVTTATSNLLKGKQVSDLKLKQSAIIDHFYASSDSGIKNKTKGLSGNNIYNIINGYSSILSLKATFKNPKGHSELPKEVHEVHNSHKNQICPITISNSDPGVTISLIPELKIDSKFGIIERRSN